MSESTNPIPSDAELRNDLTSAEEALSAVRAKVFDGHATAEDLSKAEANVSFARARLEGVEDARYLRRQNHYVKRAPEIVAEIEELKPRISKLQAIEESIKEAVREYRELHLEIQDDLHDYHAELIGIRDGDRTKSILRDNQITVTLAGFIRVKGTPYGVVSIDRLLTDLQVEATRPLKRPIPQRPQRRKSAA